MGPKPAQLIELLSRVLTQLRQAYTGQWDLAHVQHPAALPSLASVQEGATVLVDEPDAATHQHHLTVTESMAQELLRIAGENQIGTNQVLTRIGQLVAGVKSAESYHQKFANWRRVLITSCKYTALKIAPL